MRQSVTSIIWRPMPSADDNALNSRLKTLSLAEGKLSFALCKLFSTRFVCISSV